MFTREHAENQSGLTALHSFTSATAETIDRAINATKNSDELDQLSRLLWRGYGEGAISEGDATFLDGCICRRRPPGRGSAVGHLKMAGGSGGRLAARLGSRFRSR